MCPPIIIPIVVAIADAVVAIGTAVVAGIVAIGEAIGGALGLMEVGVMAGAGVEGGVAALSVETLVAETSAMSLLTESATTGLVMSAGETATGMTALAASEATASSLAAVSVATNLSPMVTATEANAAFSVFDSAVVMQTPEKISLGFLESMTAKEGLSTVAQGLSVTSGVMNMFADPDVPDEAATVWNFDPDITDSHFKDIYLTSPAEKKRQEEALANGLQTVTADGKPSTESEGQSEDKSEEVQNKISTKAKNVGLKTKSDGVSLATPDKYAKED